MNVSGHGLSVEVPDGWEARISCRAGGGPVLHLATFALHERDGDYGAAATGRMGSDDIFAALLQFAGDERIRPGHGLFERHGRPGVSAGDFAANQLQVTRPGQCGTQAFFSEAGHARCLYAVVMPVRRSVAALAGELAGVLATLAITARQPTA